MTTYGLLTDILEKLKQLREKLMLCLFNFIMSFNLDLHIVSLQEFISHVFWDSLYLNILEWSRWPQKKYLYLINFEIPVYARPYRYRTYLFGN